MLTKSTAAIRRLGQIFFAFREVVRLVAQVNLSLLIAVFLLNAIWGFLAIPGFYLEKLILDTLIGNIGNPAFQSALFTIGLLLSGRILLDILRNILGNVNRILRRILSRRVNAYLEVLLAKKFGELDLATIEDPEFRDRYNNIDRQYGRTTWALMLPLSDIPNYVVGLISSVGVLFFLHPLVSLGILLFSLPQFFVDSRFIKKGYELEKKASPLYRLWGWFSYYLYRNRNFAELKILNLSGYLTNRLISVQKEVIDPEITLERKREFSKTLSFLLLSVFELVISIWTAILAITQKITVGSMELYLRSIRSAQSNLAGLVTSLLEVYENYIYVSDLVWFLHLKPKISSNSEGLRVTNDPLEISCKNLLFRYKKEQPWTIKNISFTARQGERIAIVGKNGAGKSTLIKLLSRFYDPNKGEILVNGKNLADYDVYQWRESLAILFQDFEGYPFSGRESIGFGDVTNIDSEGEIRRAAKMTGIDKFIEELPRGYENPLEPEFEGGVRPSAGQWQRIGIARMLFRKRARILILDEPTSNVDPEAEEKIFKELAKVASDKILIFVTQRFSTVRDADQILVIEDGRIVEQGNHKSLMAKRGKYAKLYNLQAKAYKS